MSAQSSTFPNSLVTLPGSGLGLMAMLAAYVGTLLLLGTTLTVGDTSMKMGLAFTFVGDTLSPAARAQVLTKLAACAVPISNMCHAPFGTYNCGCIRCERDSGVPACSHAAILRCLHPHLQYRHRQTAVIRALHRHVLRKCLELGRTVRTNVDEGRVDGKQLWLDLDTNSVVLDQTGGDLDEKRVDVDSLLTKRDEAWGHIEELL